MHEGFLMQNIFRDSKKIFCDFSVGMELENEKSENVNDNKNKESKMLMSLQQRKRGMPYNKSFIDQASSVKRALFSFCVFMDLDFVSVHKNAKMDLYPL